jgi:hypothetical protein
MMAAVTGGIDCVIICGGAVTVIWPVVALTVP